MLNNLSPPRDRILGRALSWRRTGPPRKGPIIIAIAVALEIAGLAAWALLAARPL